MNDKAVLLNDDELRALALRIAAEQLRLTEMWLDWELYPMLDAGGFDRLNDEAQNIGEELRKRSQTFDVDQNIDSALLLERVS